MALRLAERRVRKGSPVFSLCPGHITTNFAGPEAHDIAVLVGDCIDTQSFYGKKESDLFPRLAYGRDFNSTE